MVDKGVCTKGDTLNTGHGCDTTSSLDTPGQDKVYVEDKLVARVGDSTVPHNDGSDSPTCSSQHTGSITQGSSKVYVVGELVARIEDAVDAGTLTSGSSKVFAG